MIKEQIEQKLEREFNPAELTVINESHQHRTAAGAETHFKVIVVSDVFQNLSRIQRHQKIHGLLRDELQAGVHALTIQALTTHERKSAKELESPACRHKE